MGESIVGKRIAQLGLIVKDVEEAKRCWAGFLGVPVPPTVSSGEYAVTHTLYLGKPAPLAQCKMAFFDVEGLQVELIEPNGAPSVWRERLDRAGEGLHHVALQVKGMNEAVERCERWGMRLEQRGEYRSGNGRYAYLNAENSLRLTVELLESDE